MLKALDKNFQTISDLTNSATLLMWERKYYECGQFSLTILLSEYTSEMKYLYSTEHMETGIINSINPVDDLITLSGFFLEKLLDDKIIHPVFNYTGNIELCARQLVATYKEDIPKLTLGKAIGLGTSISLQETGEELGKKIYTLYKTQELSYRLNYNYVDDLIYFETYKGIDRQTTFNKRINNVIKSELVQDDSNFKNYAVVAGGGEGTARKTVVVDNSGGGYKKKIFIDARDLQQQDDQTEADYLKQLTQRGKEKLDSFVEVLEFKFQLTETEATRYKIDFDLGDKIEINLPELGMDLSTRITGVTEVMKENRREISVTLGEPVPTLYQKAVMRR